MLENSDMSVMELLPNLLQHMKELRNVTGAGKKKIQKKFKNTRKEHVNEFHFNVINV